MAEKSTGSLHYRDFAILYRTNAQSRTMEEGLRKLNVPDKIYGGLSFYQRKEIRDLIAYFRLTLNHNAEQALNRPLNYHARGIAKTSPDKLIPDHGTHDKPLWETLEKKRQKTEGP